MAKYRPVRIGDNHPLQRINPDTEEIDGKIYVSQNNVVLGRVSAGDGPHEEIPFGDLPGGGGGASYTEITYADMATAIADETLTPGGWYLITDAAGTDLGFLTYAVNENTIAVAGVGGYLNADFQDVGVYDGVEAITGIAPGTRRGIWRTGFEALTIAYTNLSGGTFAVGDTITGGTTGATAVVVTDDGGSIMTIYMTSPGVAFDGSEVLDNGSGVTADMDGAATGPDIQEGDIVIWNLLHWQLTDATVLDGTDPATNTAAYTQLLKTDADQGYITAWDESEFDFPNQWLQYRADTRGNRIRYSAQDEGGIGESAVIHFQFGNENWYGNDVQLGYILQKNSLCSIYKNILIGQSTIRGNTGAGGSIFECFLNTGRIRNNVIEENSGVNACFILGGSIADSYIAADILTCTLQAGSSMYELFIPQGSNIAGNTLGQDSEISNISAAGAIEMTNNILENGAQLTGITAGANCSISRNKVGQGATLGGGTTMGDGAQKNDLEIRANKAISNKEIDAGIALSDKVIHVTLDETETISANVEGNRSQPGFSDIPATIDITGLTTLDSTAAFAQYRGIYNLTSSNATESIDTITNPPTAFPFTIRPAAGLVLTVILTAYIGIAAGQIAGKATDYTLDGNKGEYIVLEIDPLGTGALIEKQVVAGII